MMPSPHCDPAAPISCKQWWNRIEHRRNHPFLILPGEEYAYSHLREAVLRWLTIFDQAGLCDGERIVFRSGFDFAASAFFVAALLDGKVPACLSADTPDSRLLSIARTVDARLIVHDGPELTQIPDCTSQFILTPFERAPSRGMFAIFKSRDRLAEIGLAIPPAEREPALPVDEDRLGYLLFTSGTTSSPIGVQITLGNLFANLATLSRLFKYDANSRIFNDMVLAHADGMIQGPVMALANGGCVIRAGGFTLNRLESWLEQVRANRATHFITVPTIWMMIDAHAAHDDYFDAPELVSLQSVAAKLPEDIWRRLEARFAHPISNHYGLTETVASALYAGPQSEMGPRGTIGKPIDCEARIDPPAAIEGELQLRGANVSGGYWRNPQRNAESFTNDGWLKTGDIVRLNGDGSYSILGRSKNIIMTGGFLIRPDEIDEAMLKHPLVRESVTVALEDEMFGEIPATTVVADPLLREEDLFAHARANLEAQKVPRKIVFALEIPRGVSGKPVLAKIRENLLAAGHDQARTADNCVEVEMRVIALAADIFRIPADQLVLAHGPDQVAGWDSFSHLNLILETERQFSIKIAASRIASIASLDDLCGAIRERL